MHSALYTFAFITFLGVAEPYIEIEKPPENREYYSRRATNEYIRAKIGGGLARRVWLANDAPNSPRAALTKSGKTRYEINVEDPAIDSLLNREDDIHHLRVFAEMEDGSVVSSAMFNIRRKLPHLTLSSDEVKFTVMQNNTSAVPGSNGSLSVSLGDITSGQVTITVVDNEWRPMAAPTSVRPGDGVLLRVDKERYIVGCRKLINNVLGGDQGIFVVCRPKRWEQIRITIMLDRIARSTDTFIQDGKELTGTQFAKVLKTKMKESRAKIEDVDAFLTRIAGRPESPDQLYKVKFEDGTTQELTAWLRRELDREEAEGVTSQPGDGS